MAAPIERKLTNILSADVFGYSRLMGQDEAGTLATLTLCRTAMAVATTSYHGRIIDATGDCVLAEFASVVLAVECAVAIQRDLGKRNAELPANRQMRFRVGINLGDVIVENDALYGDGVNVAARLEGLAEPGGICISGAAFDHVVHKVDVGFASLGEQRLKNIADPVRVYRVLLDPSKAGKIGATSYWPGSWTMILVGVGVLLTALIVIVLEQQRPSGPQRPSVAVLPFANLGGDPNQDYFTDGVTENLITDLAKRSGLDVIARNSVFAYKGKTIVLADVARQLGVRYLVEGSVQRTGDQIRINAQLIDMTTGDNLWANRFDRRVGEVLGVQDEISRDIVTSLGTKPTALETERMTRPPTANLEAYDYYLRGEQAARTGRPCGLRDALNLYAQAVALDPSFAEAWAADARTAVYVWRNTYDDVLQSAPARKRAYESVGRALQLNPDLSLPYAMLAVLQNQDGRYEEAIASAQRAVALGPGDVEAYIALGHVHLFAGNFAKAVAAIETALRLDPNLSPINRQVAGLVFCFNGDHDRAIAALERARDDAPGVGSILISLAAAYARAGRMADARIAVAQGLRLPSNDYLYSIASIRLGWEHFRNGKDLEFLLDALRQAGLPEWPFGFVADERDQLQGEAITCLVLGHTLQGHVEPDVPAMMQIRQDGNAAFRSARQFTTETVFVDRDLLCERSENIFGRADCGPVYKRNSVAGEPNYTYVNSSKVFYFSPVG